MYGSMYGLFLYFILLNYTIHINYKRVFDF